MLHFIFPVDSVFFTDDSIEFANRWPVFSFIIYVDMPDSSFKRLLFILNWDSDHSLHIVVEIIFITVVDWYEVRVKSLTLLLVECQYVHHLWQGEFCFEHANEETLNYLSVWMFDVDGEVRKRNVFLLLATLNAPSANRASFSTLIDFNCCIVIVVVGQIYVIVAWSLDVPSLFDAAKKASHSMQIQPKLTN